MHKKKFLLVQFLPNGITPFQPWCLEFTHEEYKSAKKSVKEHGLMPLELIRLVKEKTDQFESGKFERIVLPEIIGEAPKGTKPGPVSLDEINLKQTKTFPDTVPSLA